MGKEENKYINICGLNLHYVNNPLKAAQVAQGHEKPPRAAHLLHCTIMIWVLTLSLNLSKKKRIPRKAALN